MREFTIIIPIYNEVENITRLSERMNAYLQKASVKAQVLFVDDGSTDGSYTAIKKVCQENDKFFYISFCENRGLSMALKAGFDWVKTPYLGYIDADLQTAPEDFEKLLCFREKYAMVTGIRKNRKDSLIKKCSSKIANSFRRMMVGDKITDTGCPLKVFQTAIAQKLPFFNGNHRFFASLVGLFEGEVKQVPVAHFPRKLGTAKFGLRNRLFAPFMDCFHVRWLQKRHRNYRLKQEN